MIKSSTTLFILATAKRAKMTFEAYILKEKYKKIHGLGDRLALTKAQIDWKPFIKIIEDAFNDNEETGGKTPYR